MPAIPQTDTPVFDHLRADSMLAAIEAVSSRHAGDEAITSELGSLEAEVRRRRQSELASDPKRQPATPNENEQ